MRVTHNELKQCATNLLALWDRENIQMLDDIARRGQSTLQLSDGEYVLLGSSNPTSSLFPVMYIASPGSVIEAMRNPFCVTCIVKEEDMVPGYVQQRGPASIAYSCDEHGNLRQERLFVLLPHQKPVGVVREELKRIISL